MCTISSSDVRKITYLRGLSALPAFSEKYVNPIDLGILYLCLGNLNALERWYMRFVSPFAGIFLLAEIV